MNELGQWLRQTREEMGVSLAEAEAQTRIRQRFLAAMEAEDWDALPGDVTTKGFLRKYATFLKLDPQEAVQRYHGSAERPAPMEETNGEIEERDVDYRPMEMELTRSLPSVSLPWRAIAAGAAALILLAIGWWVITIRPNWSGPLTAFLPEQLPRDSAAALATTPSAEPTQNPFRVTATPTFTPEPTETEPANSTPTLAADEESALAVAATTPTPDTSDQRASELLLAIEVTRRSYIRVTVDGTVREEAIWESGEEGEWTGQESISLRTGNAIGVQATVNDVAYPPLGGSGDVVEIVWTLEDGQVVDSTPTAPTATPSPPQTESPQQAVEITQTEQPADETTATAEATEVPSPSATPTATAATEEPTATPPATVTPTPATLVQVPTRITAEALEVLIEITDPAWVRVTVDGQNRMEGILEPGAVRNWTGQRAVNLRIGNAGGVVVSLNGETLGKLGEAREVVDLTWRLQDGRVITTTPTPTPLPRQIPTARG